MMTNSEVEPHRDGHIVSPNFPLSISRSNFSRMAKRVTLQLTVCRKCSISLHFRDSSLPYCHYPDRQLLAMQQTNLCAIGCSYFYLHEPYYKKTTRYIVRSAYYKTSSRSLLLVFCKGKYDTIRFNISYKIEDKTVTPNGQDNGTFMSLGYPGPYALNGDIYTYEIHSPGNYIRLTFDGWDLSYWTTIEIHYMHKNKSRSLIRRGFHPRPISQSYEHLTVVFSTGIDTSLFTKRPYLGFHARYEYVKEESWPEYPSVVCGEYFHLDKGGYFESPRCLPGQSVDCLWVIGPPHQLRVTRILINFQEQHMRRWTLKIRQGVTSWGPSVYNSQMFPKQSSSDALSPSGFYISLKYECQISASFNATFAYFDYPNYNNYCTNLGYQFHCKRQERCISEKLRCDGYNHCGDSSDENDCQGPTTLPRCRNGLLYHCPSNNRRICAEERCDGIKDCPLGSDERNCPATTSHPPREQSVGVSHWSTLVPIILICVIIVIVGCIAITWYIQCRHRRHPHEAHTPPGRVARHLRTISHQLGSTRWSGVDQNGLEHDAPPGYHEAVLYFPRAEAVNLGYTRTDSLEAFPKPPPYSPTLGLECIPPPSYEQINPRTLTDGFTSLQGLTGNHASPQVLTDNHASPHVLTDNHTSPHVLTDNHTSPHVLADNHTSPHVLTDNHASPHVLTDNHTSSHMLTDNHTSPHALTDNHASPHMLTDNHASPHMLTENHASPQVLTDNHASPHMLTENHTSPQVLTDNHASPHVLTDNNASPQVLTDNHASQQMLTDRSEGPLVLTDNYASFGRTTTLQFMENTDPDVEGLNATTV